MDEDDEWDEALELQFKASARSTVSEIVGTSALKQAETLGDPSITAPLPSKSNPVASTSDLTHVYLPSLKKQRMSSTGFDNCQTPQISFRFPGWGVEIKKERDQLAPSITRDAAPSKNAGDFDTATGDHAPLEKEGNTCRPWEDDGIENGTHLLHLPEEVLASVLNKLGPRDLCSLRYTPYVKL